MYIDFEQMPTQARVWVYQANRKLNQAEINEIESKTQSFLSQWTAHQQSLKASFKVFYEYFLVITLDESHNLASGCSIDASVHFIQELEQTLEIKLLDKSQVAFWKDNQIQTESLKNLKQVVQTGIIQTNTLIFNNTISNLNELNTNWQIPAEKSWVARYFSKVNA